MYSVRPLKPSEVPIVVQAGAVLHAQSAFKHMAYDVPACEKLVQTALARPKEAFFEVVDFQGVPAGLLFAIVQKSFFGPDLVAMDLVFFLWPDHYGKCSEQLQQLVDNYRRWAQSVGAKKAHLGCSTQMSPERTRKIFEHLGFPQTGSLHSVPL